MKCRNRIEVFIYCFGLYAIVYCTILAMWFLTPWYKSLKNQSPIVHEEMYNGAGSLLQPSLFPRFRKNSLVISKVQHSETALTMKTHAKTTLQHYLSLAKRSHCEPFSVPFANRTDSRSLQQFVEFYKPNPDIINQLDHEFIVANEQMCKDEKIFLLILVVSRPSEQKARNAIRRTWGNFTGVDPWGPFFKRFPFKLLFLFGRGYSTHDDEIVLKEHREHGDVLQASFADSYFNLTRKILTGISWVSQHCPNVGYVLKTDSDTFVHVPNLIYFLYKEGENSMHKKCGKMFGRFHANLTVYRKGKWNISEQLYPLDKYPTYASGYCYVISADVLSSMVQIARHIPIMNIEDAFMTGVLRTLGGVQHISANNFQNIKSHLNFPCAVKRFLRICKTAQSPERLYTLWKDIRDGLPGC